MPSPLALDLLRRAAGLKPDVGPLDDRDPVDETSVITDGRRYILHEEPTDALVVACADPRFLQAILWFLWNIGVRTPATILVPGSVKSVGLEVVMPEQWHTLRHHLELMTERNRHVNRVILFTHDECRSYAASAEYLRQFPSVAEAQRDHLLRLRDFMAAHCLPEANYELYHAAIVPGNSGRCVQFRRIIA